MSAGHEPSPCLNGLGLRIRPFMQEDGPAFVEAVRESVATVGLWMDWCHADYTLDEAKLWFASAEEAARQGLAFELGIFLESTGLFCGGISINQINEDHCFGNVGYWVRESLQGRQIAVRAVKLISEFGFASLRLTRLEIVAAESNIRSRRVAEKSGAQFECVARNRLRVRGKLHRAAIYALLPGDVS